MHKHKLPKPLFQALLAEASKTDVTGFSMSMPFYILLGESIDVARFTEHYWLPVPVSKSGAPPRPGLRDAGASRLPKSIAAEIVTLQDLVQKAQTSYLLAITPPSESMERAEFVLDEVSAAVEWLCDDGDPETNAKLAAIVDAHRDDAETDDALASQIADYVGLARQYEDELAEIGAFDPALLEEGEQLVVSLRERSAARVAARTSEASKLLQHRNQLAALLIQRMTKVRAAARYIFRNHPEIVKQVTSAYQRRRRAAARKRAAEQAMAPVEPALVTEGGSTPPA